ncbi:MAG: hypothetical protein CMJ46_09005 [Planctomyces sp.]|nr:hypothetical protein [Planctomyces sp.]
MMRLSGKMKLVVVTAVLSLLVGGGMLLQRQSNAADPRADQTVEAMTHSEKLQVQKNLAYFQKLSPAEQKSLRDTHEAIQGDSDRRAMFNLYTEWLNTLTAWQRRELAEASTTYDRLDLVNRFLEENRSQEKQREAFNDWWNEVQKSERQEEEELEQLPDQLAQILKPLQLKLELSPEVQQELESLDQAERVARVFRIALEQEFQSMSREGKQDPLIFTPELVNEMVRQISSKEGRNSIERFPPQAHGIGLVHYVKLQLEKYFRDYEKKGKDPSVDELQVVFDQLNEQAKTEIGAINDSPDRFKRLLTQYWLNQDLGEIERMMISQRKRDYRRNRDRHDGKHRGFSRPDSGRGDFGRGRRPNDDRPAGERPEPPPKPEREAPPKPKPEPPPEPR